MGWLKTKHVHPIQLGHGRVASESDLKVDNNGRISHNRVCVRVGGPCEGRKVNQDIKRKRNTRRKL